MSTRAKVYALDARGGVIASQYHHHDGYESNALPAIVAAFLSAGEHGDAVAVMSALLREWDGEWSAGHAPEIGSDETTDLDYEYLITVKGAGRIVLEVKTRGDFITEIDEDGDKCFINLPAIVQRLDGIGDITARMVTAAREAAESNANTPLAAAYADEVTRVEGLAVEASETANAWQVMGALEEMAAA